MSPDLLAERQDNAASPSPTLPRNLLGPLTSTFTPPADCFVPAIACATCDVGWYGQTCASTNAGDASACWPGATAGVPTPTQPYAGWGFYSPGTVCPSGYEPACSATFGATTSTWAFMFSLTQGETATGCCPHGMTCANIWGGTQTCIARYVSTTISGVVSCSGTDRLSLAWTIPATYTATSTQSSGGTVGTTTRLMTLTNVALYAPLIQINHGTSDTSSSTTAPASTSSTSEGNGLSVGSVAGISVGAVVGAVALAAALILCFRHRRGARNVGMSSVPPGELDGTGRPTHELGKPEVPRSSMPHQVAVELGTLQQAAAELTGSSSEPLR